MAQISCKDLCLGYESRRIIEDLSFEVHSGDYLCILGENGSGKTTLMRTLLGLHKPIAGAVELGDDLKQSEIGYLPQQTQVQKDFPASVEEIVLSGCGGRRGISPFYTKQDRQTALDAMERMDILPLKKRCYRELSGGQQQRVLLARALCATKKLLLLDEPVSGLDPRVSMDMYRSIYELNKEDGITVIMISHDINAAIRYASHILYIGKEIFFGRSDDFVSGDIARSLLTGGDGR